MSIFKKLAISGAALVAFASFGLNAPVANAASLSQNQISAIVGLLQSFGADSGTIASVQAALGGQSTTGGQSFCYNFNNDLTVGSRGADVSALNQALASSGVDTSGNGSNFTENTAADVVSFQAKYGIRQTGYVGPLTRGKLNALYGCQSGQQTTNPIQPGVPTVSASSGFSSGPTNDPLTIRFDVQPSFSNAPSDSVYFGDGSSSLVGGDSCGPTFHVCSVDHAYAAAGTYTAVLKDPSGNSLASATVVVNSSTNTLTQPGSTGLVGTIDIASLNTGSATPTITGTFSGANAIRVIIGTQPIMNASLSTNVVLSGESDHGGGVSLNGNRYSYTVPALSALANGRYWIGVYTVNTSWGAGTTQYGPYSLLATGALTVGSIGNPNAVLSASPASGTLPLSVTFSGSFDTTVYGEGGGYAISYGDGQVSSSQIFDCPSTTTLCSVSANHTYVSPGTYQAQLTNDQSARPGASAPVTIAAVTITAR